MIVENVVSCDQRTEDRSGIGRNHDMSIVFPALTRG